ncbi:MAG: hypothetical protein JXA25_08640 [Anaerolineales bacterium]|nr:hypothetical protein [Anaerolineales bacterium]
MKSLHILYHIVRADFYERFRRYNVLIVISLVVFLTTLYLPPQDVGRLAFNVGGYRGIYNSAWVGATVTILTIIFMSLPGFYLVKNAITRDEDTKVGQIIATTSLSKVQYIFGKTISNWVFLAAASGVGMLSAMGIQLLRGESLKISLSGYLLPYLLITLPMMALMAAAAVLFESIRRLRRGFGNVVFFFLYLINYWILIAMTILLLQNTAGVSGPPVPLIPEPTGALEIFRNISAAGMELIPGHPSGLDLGNPFQVYGQIGTFVWTGINWKASSILGRLLWVAVAIGIASAAAARFDRFDPSSLKVRSRNKKAPSRSKPDIHPAQAPDSIRPASTALSASVRHGNRLNSFLHIVSSELRLMLKGQRWWWYAAAMGLITAAVALPGTETRQIVLPVVCVWPLLIWSQLGNREIQNRTDQLVFSSAYPLRRQLSASWVAGIILTLITGSGVIVRLITDGSWSAVLALVIAAAFIPALALALGVWSRGSRLFEVVYLFLWALGPMNQMMAAFGFPMSADRLPVLDFIGSSDASISAGIPLYYALFTLLLLALALIGRKRQIQG